jgi:hypothetical protein
MVIRKASCAAEKRNRVEKCHENGCAKKIDHLFIHSPSSSSPAVIVHFAERGRRNEVLQRAEKLQLPNIADIFFYLFFIALIELMLKNSTCA